MENFFTICYSALMEKNIDTKCTMVQQIYKKWIAKEFDLTPHKVVMSTPNPGVPENVSLVSPLKVPKRKINTTEGFASLIHSLVHIEFNAINLGLDACYRFQHMPADFYANWIEVTQDEARHFTLLHHHLNQQNFSYGDFVAHNGIWDMALRTEADVLLRMALVARVLEARGIDAVPEIKLKLDKLANPDLLETLNIIYQDEIKHVLYGNRWFQYECNKRGLDPETTYFQLLEQYNAPKIRGAFNREGRKMAGFTESELDILQS